MPLILVGSRFRRFAVGPGCGPVVGQSDVRSVSSALFLVTAQAPDLGPLACPRYIPLARRPQRKCRHHTLISFIWSPGNALPAGTGGSENYTVGQVRELTRRGIAAQVVTVGLGTSDGRDDFADVPFLALPTLAAVSELDSTVVFVNEPHTVPTMHPAFVILHNPPPIRERERAFAVEGTKELALIATSRYAAALWSAYLDVDIATISVVYPFAEPSFAAQPRPGRADGKTRILFAGRLSPEKG